MLSFEDIITNIVLSNALFSCLILTASVFIRSDDLSRILGLISGVLYWLSVPFLAF